MTRSPLVLRSNSRNHSSIYNLKYSFLFFIALFIIIVANTGYGSAWLIEPGQYRYTLTVSNIDKNSKQMKQERADLRLAVEKQLESLKEQLKFATKSSAFYKKLLNQIKLLERTSQELTGYQEERNRIISVEYGINNIHNIGFQLLYKDYQFQGTQYKSPTLISEEISAFYKIKLFANNNHIISIQPKVTVIQHNSSQQFSYEILLLSGTSQTKGSIVVFTDSSFTFGQNLYPMKQGQKYYAVSATKGIKLNNDIMLVNFVKYYISSKNYNAIYNKTIYNQFSIAKHVKFGNLKQHSLIAQIGYFSDRSLIKSNYKISGVTFSIWIEM
ncbi:hypothetical protein [Candidatus Tisiphia endosymbiont of Nemotelus uliginosus]|uniref:hypothetical protein n=1 Tax=Candidatus Tisiphia endosymbiont of Nemotelus uliginosus TaxID=3077926 RepID=UPI0035C914E6